MPDESQRLNKLIIYWLRINIMLYRYICSALRLRSTVICKFTLNIKQLLIQFSLWETRVRAHVDVESVDLNRIARGWHINRVS